MSQNYHPKMPLVSWFWFFRSFVGWRNLSAPTMI